MSSITIQGAGFPVAGRGTAGPSVLAARWARADHVASKPLRLTRRGRLAVTLASLLTVTAVAVVGAHTASAGSTVPAAGTQVQEVVVMPGDTLWSLASATDGTGDIRDRVALLRSLNDLESSTLMVGQRLLVPTA